MAVTLPHHRTAADALVEHGLDGPRLLKLARSCARDGIQKRGGSLGHRLDDLTSYLTEVGLREALRYDPARSQPGYGFPSYLYDVMDRRVDDFFRRKSEGFGDRRYGNDQRVVLAGNTLDDEADPDVDFEKLLSERRVARYQRAATLIGIPITEWIVITLDVAARQAERPAA